VTRTTLAFEDDLFQEMRERAHREGRSLTALANALLRKALRAEAEPRAPMVSWTTYDCGQPLVDVLDHDALLDALDRP